MQALKVPFLKPTDIDHAVRELLHNYSTWREEPAKPPIDVDEIIEGYLGLALEIDNLKSRLGMPDVLGATWFEESRICIDQSLEDKEGRLAFTMAHEIGHWQLHRPLYELEKMSLSLFQSQDGKTATPAIVCRAKSGKAPAEWQADQFAARLLMPSAAIRSAVQKVSSVNVVSIEGLNNSQNCGNLIPPLRTIADDIIDSGQFTNVSNEAMCYRLLDLKLVQDEEESRSRLI
ncbi:MAG: ImmA/IrrE family metallo-endopeptidase [Rhodospirillales bacterium]|nr:ImmA/IrrE family metallo-endopeptidase [Rhodospirillales bacterium]